MKQRINQHYEFLDHVNKILCQSQFNEDAACALDDITLDPDQIDELCVQSIEQYNEGDTLGFVTSVQKLSQYFSTYHDVILAEYFCSSLLAIRLSDMLDQEFQDQHMLPVVFELITNISFQTIDLSNLMDKKSINHCLQMIANGGNDMIFIRIIIPMLYNLLIDIPLNFADFKNDISKLLDIAGKNENNLIRCMYSFLLISIFRRNSFMDEFFSIKLCSVIQYSIEHSYNIENLAWCLYYLVYGFQKCIPLMLNEVLINTINCFLSSPDPTLISIALTSISRIILSESPIVLEFLNHISMELIIEQIISLNYSISSSALCCLLNIVVFSEKHLESIYETNAIDYILLLKDDSDISCKEIGASLLSYLIINANEETRQKFIVDDIIDFLLEILDVDDSKTIGNVICAFASLIQINNDIIEKIDFERIVEINENDLSDDSQEAFYFIKSMFSPG